MLSLNFTIAMVVGYTRHMYWNPKWSAEKLRTQFSWQKRKKRKKKEEEKNLNRSPLKDTRVSSISIHFVYEDGRNGNKKSERKSGDGKTIVIQSMRKKLCMLNTNENQLCVRYVYGSPLITIVIVTLLMMPLTFTYGTFSTFSTKQIAIKYCVCERREIKEISFQFGFSLLWGFNFGLKSLTKVGKERELTTKKSAFRQLFLYVDTFFVGGRSLIHSSLVTRMVVLV